MGIFVIAACLTIMGAVVVLLNVFWLSKRRRPTQAEGRPSIVPLAAPILGGCGALLANNRWFTIAAVAILLADPGSWMLLRYAISRNWRRNGG